MRYDKMKANPEQPYTPSSSNIFFNIQSIDFKNVTYIDFNRIFEEGAIYRSGYRDEVVIKYLKNKSIQFFKLKQIVYNPDNVIDLDILKNVKSLERINVPPSKIKNIDFIFELPNLKIIGLLLSESKDAIILKKELKYEKNLSILFN